ncbi:copper resistance protein CopC [Cellulosimicrobium cellulans]|uniref:copper resistance CopC/CopD family protein n=1 Tax=Cellulosimicrobium cellulans TaxID=1710 RepID=UPI0014310D15|nr:copper resistance protein CopC [Cellulosimicrobium cellulans]
MRRALASWTPAVVTVLLGTVLGALTSVAGALPAAAHASLVATSPAHGEVLDSSPDAVTVTFDEPVTVVAGSFSVTGPDGVRHDSGTERYDDARTSVTTDLAPDLPDGTYVVSWRILSLDTHVTGGSVSFSVGAASSGPSPSLATSEPARPVVAVATPVGRWLTTIGASLLAGVALVLAWAGGPLAGTRAVRDLQRLGLVALVGGTAAQLLAQVGATSATGGAGSLLDASAWRVTLLSPFGAAIALRLAAVAAWAVLLARPVRRAWRPTSASHAPASGAVTTTLAVAVAVSVSLAGHASAAPVPALAVALTTAHILAAVTWTGGLVLVARFHRGATRAAVRALLPAWSTLALVATTVLAVSGLLRAIGEVAPVEALWTTSYGLLLLAKTGLLGALLLLGDAARRHVRSRALGEGSDEGRRGTRFRRGVATEAVVAVVVLGVSGVLATTPPARSAYSPAWAEEVVLGDVVARVAVPRVATGPVEITVDLRWDPASSVSAGTPPPLPEELAVSLRQDDRELGPIGVTFRRDYAVAPELPPGVTRYVSVGAAVPADGAWDLDVVLTLDETTAHAAELELSVP